MWKGRKINLGIPMIMSKLKVLSSDIPPIINMVIKSNLQRFSSLRENAHTQDDSVN
jgi:hypothetical protein